MQATGAEQIYGTQSISRQGEPVTREPYDRELLTDGLRAGASVPSLEEQDAALEAIQARIDALMAD